MSKRIRINLAVILFICWMIVQAARSAIGGEPYPAIKYPGFPGNGRAPLISRELYKVDGADRRLITHYESVFRHARFRKLLEDMTSALKEQNEPQLAKLKTGLRDIKGLSNGDTLEIVERKWLATKEGYAEKKAITRQVIL